MIETNLYKITLDEGKLVNINYHILAENFLDAVEQAKKKAKENKVKIPTCGTIEFETKEAEILTVDKLFSIDVVK